VKTKVRRPPHLRRSRESGFASPPPHSSSSDDDVVDGDVNEFDEEADESHNGETHGRR